MTLHPSEIDAGVVFKRTDLPGCVAFKACAGSVGDTQMAMSLSAEGYQLSTIEHMMSALFGLGIDNVIIEVDGGELPIMDGSAAPFVFMLQSAGIVSQPAKKRFLRILKPMEVREADARASLAPHDGFKLSYTLDYDHPVFAAHGSTACVEFSAISFVKEVRRARTFGFFADFEKLQELNLAQAESLDNSVVVDDSKIFNEDGLRAHDEFVKHKILDVIGDLYFLGHSIIGHFHGHKSGHILDNKLVRALLADTDAFEIASFDRLCQVPQACARKATIPAA